MNWLLISHIIVFLTMVPIAIVINKKLYQNVKLEKHRETGKIIQRILMTYSIVQCLLPALIHVLGIPFLDIEIFEKFDESFMSILTQIFRTSLIFYISYRGLHSLIIAFSRYMFIVFSHKADKIGIRKLKLVLIGSSISFPLFFSLLCQCTFSIKNREQMMEIAEQKCGRYTRLDNNSFTECLDTMLNSMEFPLYEFIHENVNSAFISMTRGILVFIAGAIHSNITELFIHIHIFTFCIR